MSVLIQNATLNAGHHTISFLYYVEVSGSIAAFATAAADMIFAAVAAAGIAFLRLSLSPTNSPLALVLALSTKLDWHSPFLAVVCMLEECKQSCSREKTGFCLILSV